MSTRILQGDCREVLKTLPDASVQMVCTSPPYWGLRDYGIPPSIWGGDSNCEHEWGDTIAVNATNHTDKARWNHTRNGRDELQPVEKRVSWLRTEVKQGQFCQQCNAWAGALGLEPSPDLFCEHIVEVFREVRRVLRPDGVCFVNLGDSYANDGKWGGSSGGKHVAALHGETGIGRGKKHSGLKPKDLVGIPWLCAFALRSDGWWLRKDIIWAKPNPMPESAEDRPTSSHEHVFMLTKSARYFWDGEAVREPCESGASDLKKMAEALPRIGGKHKTLEDPLSKASAATNIGQKRSVGSGDGRNIRDVWTIATSPLPDAHFATFPPRLAELCILAGSSEHGCCSGCGAPWRRVVIKGEPDIAHRRASGSDASGGYNGQSIKGHDAAGVQNASDVKRRILDGMREKAYSWEPTCQCDAEVVPCTVLDPFAGAGTTLMVADRLRRDAIGIELNPEYVEMVQRRITKDAGLFAQVATA